MSVVFLLLGWIIADVPFSDEVYANVFINNKLVSHEVMVIFRSLKTELNALPIL